MAKSINDDKIYTNGHLDENKRSDDSQKKTLQDHQAPAFLREPFITSGYRDSENITVKQCLLTLFTVHNETFNIWSHIIAAFIFFVYSMHQISSHGLLIGNPSTYPLLCFVLGNCTMLFFSSFAHLFCCMSWRARHTCFYIDYAAISLFTFTAGQGSIYYSRPLSHDSSSLYRYPYLFLCLSTTFSCVFTLTHCVSRHRLRKYRFFLRTGISLVKLLFDTSPFWARCFLYEPDTCSPSLKYTSHRCIFLYLLTGLVNAFRLPERLFPGYFDFFGHSHHFLHVCGVFANLDAFNVMLTDMIERKPFLSSSPYQPTFLTTFGFLIVVVFVNCCIVVRFVSKWLQTEEEELFSGSSKYLVVYRTTSDNNSNTMKENKKTQ